MPPARRRGRPVYPAHLRARVAKLRDRMAGWQADALLVTHACDVRYLTGFIGHDSWALVRAGSDRVMVLTDFRYKQQITREAPHVAVTIRRNSLAEALEKLAARWRIDRFAVQSAHMTLATRSTLVKKLSARRIVPVDDGLLAQRAVKDRHEVALICRALRCQEQALARTRELIKPGLSEQWIVAELEMHMRRGGAEGASFESIVATGANASLPHAGATTAKVKAGSIVLIDWGARLDGYCSDLTRVVALGRMPARLKEVYRIVLDAQLAAIDAIGPGRSSKAIDAVARKRISKAGYGAQFGHGLGHGIGLEIHEQPTLSPRAEGELVPGHVVTVEPAIYLPGVGGVRIEDDVLVTEKGHRVLSHLPKDMDWAII